MNRAQDLLARARSAPQEIDLRGEEMRTLLQKACAQIVKLSREKQELVEEAEECLSVLARNVRHYEKLLTIANGIRNRK